MNHCEKCKSYPGVTALDSICSNPSCPCHLKDHQNDCTSDCRKNGCKHEEVCPNCHEPEPCNCPAQELADMLINNPKPQDDCTPTECGRCGNIMNTFTEIRGHVCPKPQDWEEEFDRNWEFADADGKGFRNLGYLIPENVKSFIRQLINEQKQATKEKIKEEILDKLPLYNRWDDKTKEGYEKNGAVENLQTGRNPVLKEVRNIIETL